MVFQYVSLFRRVGWRVVLLALLVILPLSAPLTAQAQMPVVHGLFFYSPSCPHCHIVINEHWPGIVNEFGDQIRILFVNVTTMEGGAIMAQAVESMGITARGVPMLIIGSEVMTGSIEIPERAAAVIRAGLANGGVPIPPIPGIEPIFAQALGEAAADAESGATVSEAISDETAAAAAFANDPANTIAVIVLAALIISLVIVGWAGMQARAGQRGLLQRLNGGLGRGALTIAALVGVGLAISLIAVGSVDATVPTLAGAVAVLLIVFAAIALLGKSVTGLAGWPLVLVAAAGLIVAGYLAYVEVTLSEAVCGAFGNCNAVQQSDYARVAGIPVGVIGIAGYGVILALWLLRRVNAARWIDAALFGAALIGVLFSTYLTFLEPFVIGASCVWCLTSALLMIVLLWLTAPAGWAALVPTAASQPPPRHPQAHAV